MNTPVLVLNANFEPLNVCTTRRAICMMLGGKAEMLLNGRGFVRTVRELFPRPSVIRLDYMIKRPRPRVRLCKRELFRRDNYTCQYCGMRTPRLTIDHVIPRHQGGSHSWSNLVSACPACNTKKGGRKLEDARMQLLRKPSEPHATAIYLYSNHLATNQDWQDFLEGW